MKSIAGVLGTFLLAAPAGALTITAGGLDLGTNMSGVQLGVGTAQTGTITERFSTVDPFISISTTFAVVNDSVAAVRLAPRNDTSRYLALEGNNVTGTIRFGIPDGERVDYIGWYWGSIDPYNYVAFLDADGGPINLVAGAVDYGAELSGAELAGILGVALADLDNPLLIPSLYVNFAFDATELVRAVRLRQTNSAMEIDNFSYRTVPAGGGSLVAGPLAVPAPASLALLGLALFGLSARPRRR